MMEGCYTESGESAKLYHDGDDTKRNGVFIMVAKSLSAKLDYVPAVDRNRDRIIAVSIYTEGYWAVLSVFAPQAGCPKIEKDKFYLRLNDAIRWIPDGEYLTLAGDLNGHVALTGYRLQERAKVNGNLADLHIPTTIHHNDVKFKPTLGKEHETFDS
ncbi:hypothetical protein TELCIR_09499, partial [Teladorsagia circumcincta]